MTIERNTPIILQHDASPFTTMFNDVLQGIKNTSALGVYCYLASKPEGWNIRKDELQGHFNCGREHIQTCINFLKKIGVLVVMPFQDEKGRLKGHTWKLLRHIPTNSTNVAEERVSRTTGFPSDGKPSPLINKRTKQIKDLNKRSIGDSANQPKALVENYEDDLRFMAFYSLYPRKEKPRDAWKAFKSINPSDELLTEILKNVQARINFDAQWQDKQFIPHPASYLRSAQYKGEIVYKTDIKRSGRHHITLEEVMGDVSWTN